MYFVIYDLHLDMLSISHLMMDKSSAPFLLGGEPIRNRVSIRGNVPFEIYQ